MTKEHIEFVKGIATVMVAAEAYVQLEFMAALAKGMSREKLTALLQQVVDHATEEESKALCQLARAINERDPGDVGAPC